jgi:hypothetical protein
MRQSERSTWSRQTTLTCSTLNALATRSSYENPQVRNGRERDGGREGRDVGRGDGIHDTAIAPDAAAALASPPAQPPCSPLLRPRHRPACCCTRRARQTMTPASGFDSGFGFGSGLDSGSGFGSGAIGTGGSPIGVLQNDALLKSSSASLSSLHVRCGQAVRVLALRA